MARTLSVRGKQRGVEFFNMDIVVWGFGRVCVFVYCVTEQWFLMSMLAAAETEPVIPPNTRHYSDFTHSCLEAVQPQSFTLRRSAALWSYWNSRLLHTSNKVLVWDEGCSQIESQQFWVAGKPTIWQRFALSSSLVELDFLQFWRDWHDCHPPRHHKMPSKFFLRSSPLICFTTLMPCCSNSAPHLS